MQAPVVLSKKSKPNITIEDILGNDLKLGNLQYEGGFRTNLLLPKIQITNLIKIFSKTDIWEKMFSKVALSFNNEEEKKAKTVKDIQVGLVGIAKAKMEKAPAIYEITVFKSTDTEIIIEVGLKNCKENNAQSIEFSNMKSNFRFVQQGEDVLFTLNMLYTRKASRIERLARDMALSIKIVMPEALGYCLKTLWKRIYQPMLYQARQELYDKIQVNKVSGAQLIGYGYGVQCSHKIPTKHTQIFELLETAASYNELHDRFNQESPQQIRLSFLKSFIVFNIQSDKQTKKVYLNSTTGFYAVSGIQIVFNLLQDQDQTTVLISFNFNMRFKLDFFAASLVDQIYQSGEDLIKTTLANIYGTCMSATEVKIITEDAAQARATLSYAP